MCFFAQRALRYSADCSIADFVTPPSATLRWGHLAVGRSASFCGTDKACSIVSPFTPPSARTLAAGHSVSFCGTDNACFIVSLFTLPSARTLAVGPPGGGAKCAPAVRTRLVSSSVRHFAVRKDRLAAGRSERCGTGNARSIVSPSFRRPQGPWRRGHLAVGHNERCGTGNARFIVSLFTLPSAGTHLAAGPPGGGA